MSTTTEPKTKKDNKRRQKTSSKKRKAAECLEETVDITNYITPSLSPSRTSGREDETIPRKDRFLTSASNLSSGPSSKKHKSLIPAEIEVDIKAPTPPTKRAIRLLRKGKAAPPLKPDNRPDISSDVDDSPLKNGNEKGALPTKKSKSKKAQPEVEKRSEYGIWIGNLPWSCDKAALRNFFTNFSDISDEDITRIHLPSPADSEPANKVDLRKQMNKGFAYVDFASVKNVEQALELSEELLMGRRVLIKDQKSFEGRPEKTKEEKRAEGKPPNKRIFVGNLRYDATVESLTAHFESCGGIDTVFVATFEDSGKCKGYAWVTFQELEAAEKAVKGYVMVPEEQEHDGSANFDNDAGSDSDEEVKKPKKIKMRKVWVNRIFGRQVRTEFAEDAQVRYKKRYGKDGTKNSAAAAADESHILGMRSKARKETGESVIASGAVPTAKPADFYRNPYAPRLTGGVVASTGKKVVFQEIIDE